MPRHTEISGSICNYITAYILAKRAAQSYPFKPSVARIWENTADAWNNRVLNEWGW